MDQLQQAIISSIYNSGYANGYNKAIDECLEIVKFHKDNWDGIEWAIRDIEELKAGVRE